MYFTVYIVQDIVLTSCGYVTLSDFACTIHVGVTTCIECSTHNSTA